MFPGKASSPTFGNPRVADAISEPGPNRTMLVSNPLRRIRVAVRRLTTDTEL
jgi:hypothetical protein